jgi:hypothetical protein
VTDRYIGYRHNLTRNGGQPLNVHTVWADRKLPRTSTAVQQSTPDWKNWVHAYRRIHKKKQIILFRTKLFSYLDYGPSATTATLNRPTTNNNPNLLGYLRRTQTAGLFFL